MISILKNRLGKNNDDWKISFYNYYKLWNFCGEPFLKSDLIYVTTNNDDPENVVETLRLCRMFNSNQSRSR